MTKPTSGNPSVEIYSGPPDEELEGGWPSGWVKMVFRRTKSGIFDRYYFTPEKKFKLRSLKKVKQFIDILATRAKGDEEKALAMIGGKG